MISYSVQDNGFQSIYIFLTVRNLKASLDLAEIVAGTSATSDGLYRSFILGNKLDVFLSALNQSALEALNDKDIKSKGLPWSTVKGTFR